LAVKVKSVSGHTTVGVMVTVGLSNIVIVCVVVVLQPFPKSTYTLYVVAVEIPPVTVNVCDVSPEIGDPPTDH